MQKCSVLIVGGGPVGLALAGELGWRGIACMSRDNLDENGGGDQSLKRRPVAKS
jgi:thioredoxin reductase